MPAQSVPLNFNVQKPGAMNNTNNIDMLLINYLINDPVLIKQ